MNVLFVSISSLPHISEHSISLDLIHEFLKHGHKVYIVCAIESRDNIETNLSQEAGCEVLRVKIGNNKRAGLIEKGITTLTLPNKYISAIKKYYSNVKFDLVLYPTPPVTQVKTVKYIKKRDGAKSYLLLKDIFPQNSVDLGMLSRSGVKSIIYKHFRNQEKQLYAVSDRIGCMSQANVDYVLEHNPSVSRDKIEICPNSIEPVDMRISAEQKAAIRAKYGLPLDKKIFVYGGNLGRPQDVPFIVECFKKCKNAEDAYFVVAGKGTHRHLLDEYVESEKPENIKLFDYLPKEEYDRMVAACDVGLIFLDHRFTIPNFPSRSLAYMQAGLPMLAATDPNTDIGTTIVEGGFGWWCESNSSDSFCSLVNTACAELCKHPDMGVLAFEYLVSHYDAADAYKVIEKSMM